MKFNHYSNEDYETVCNFLIELNRENQNHINRKQIRICKTAWRSEMYIIKAEAYQAEKIVDMSVRAFETDVNVGGAKGDCPPEFDSVEWHRQMAREGHLYLAMIDNDLVGAAIVFPDETKRSVYIGRIFVDMSCRFRFSSIIRRWTALTQAGF